jgi:hypothetical protein
MSTHPFTRMVASGLLATAIVAGAATPSQSMPLPVTSVQKIAGAAPTENVYWRGYGWGYHGYGWGWRRPNYGGAIAAGAIAGGILGLAAAASTPYYGYGYPAYRRVYYRPAYYRPVYYRRAYYRPVYYRRAYWRPVYYRRAYYRPAYFYRRPYYRRAYWW